MAGNLFVLKGVSDFAPGAFENTAVEAGSIQLGQRGTEYLQKGSYTSPAFRPRPFRRLLASWNTDTPEGTTVEVQVRVAVQGQWSRWLSFGTWSPFIYRASREEEQDEVASIQSDILVVNGGAEADTAQLRILLETQDVCRTPLVRLLSATTDNVAEPDEDEPVPSGRTLYSPAYSCLVRDPSIGGHIASATTLTMLMNRWGEDVLPEEVARAMYDTESGRFSNMGFLSAAGGMYGYECYTRFCHMDDLRREVQHNYNVAARVHYRAPSLGEQAEAEREQAETERPQADQPQAAAQEAVQPGPVQETARPAALPLGEAPVYDGAVADSNGHFVVVYGFAKESGSEVVLVCDPLSRSDDEVHRKIPVEEFAAMYTGLAIFLHKGPHHSGKAKPERKLTTLQMDAGENEIRLSAHGELLQPGLTIPGKASRATVCYTLSDGVAYATAAQKKFYYIKLDESGHIAFDVAAAYGRKLTFYVIGSKGTTWVGEKRLEEAKVQKS